MAFLSHGLLGKTLITYDPLHLEVIRVLLHGEEQRIPSKNMNHV
jgi:hypothetical protein